MIERRLTPAGRVVWACNAALSLGLVGLFVVLFLRLPSDAPMGARIGIGAGGAFALAWCILALGVARRGVHDLRFHGNLMSALIWGLNIILMTIFLYAGTSMPDAAKGSRVILFGLVFWSAFAIPTFIGRAVQQSELRLREHMLKLELELAQLAENLKK